MSKLKRISMLAAAMTIVAESGLKNVLVTTLVAVGTPATATGFVYSVVHMRKATLDREAHDRQVFSSGNKSTASAAGPMPGSDVAQQNIVSGSDDSDGPNGPADLKHRIKSAVLTRSRFLDAYGDELNGLTPVYRTIANTLLADDERLFAEIDAARASGDADGIGTTAEELRAVDRRMKALNPAQVAANAPVLIQTQAGTPRP